MLYGMSFFEMIVWLVLPAVVVLLVFLLVVYLVARILRHVFRGD